MTETPDKPVVLVTGSSGYLGGAVVRRLHQSYRVVGLDRHSPPHPPYQAECVCFDITDQESVDKALARVRLAYGDRIAACIHLAAYFDLTGEDNPAYDAVTVEGTKRLLKGLQEFQLEQFVFASTMLAHAPTSPGQPIDEDVPFDNVLKQYFQADNFRTWLGINILLSNDDTNSQNFYLYRPSQIDNFYFTPWDYDGAWDFFGQPAEQLDFPQRPRWTQGIANWWAMPLVSRYVRNGGIPALEAKLDALQAGALAPANVEELIESYPIDEIVQVLINQQGPDLDGLPTVNDGRSAEPQIRQEIERLPGTIAAAREEFDSTLDRPMPVYTAALLENGNVVLRWDESYDIQNKGLRYDVRLATSPVLNGTRNACTEDDDAMPMLNTNVVFSRDGIQGTSVVPTTALTRGQRYYAQVIVRDGDGYCQSSFDEYYDSDEDETYYGVFGFTFTGSEIVTAYDE